MTTKTIDDGPVGDTGARRLRRVAATLVALAAVTVGISGAVAASTAPTPSGTTYEGPGAASAEDAVTAYMSAMAAGDLDQMVGAFAIETYVDHFDMPAYLEWVRVYSMASAPLLVPAGTPFSRALGVEQRQANVVGLIARQYIGLAAPDLDLSQTVDLTDDSAVDDFSAGLDAAVGALDTSGVGSFTFVPLTEVDPNAAELYQSAQNQTNIDTRVSVLGADEMTDLVARFDVAGQPYLAFFSAVRYGDAWWLEQLGGNFATLMGVEVFDVGAVPADSID